MSENNSSAAVPDDARENIEAELARLRQSRDRMVAEFQGDRDTVGDHGDAADAIQRADEVASLDDRIAELTRVLAGGAPRAQSPGGLPGGTDLTLRFPDDTEAVHLRVVLIEEETPAGREDSTVTADSPLGRALAGHQPGDTVTYLTPQGQRRVELLAVKYPT